MFAVLNAATRGRGSTPQRRTVFRTSVLVLQVVSRNQWVVYLPLRELLCFNCISKLFQQPFFFPLSFCKEKTLNRMCHFFLPECAIQAVSRRGATTSLSLLWSCSSTCPGVIAPPPGGASVQTFIWMWRAVSSFLVCFVIRMCSSGWPAGFCSSVLSFYCLLLRNCPVLQRFKNTSLYGYNFKKNE